MAAHVAMDKVLAVVTVVVVTAALIPVVVMAADALGVKYLLNFS
jgi:hypothetical protein